MDVPLGNLLIGVVWLAAVGLGIYEYGRSKGRIGRALSVTLGGGLLATFIVRPELLYDTIPTLFGNLIDWAVKQSEGGGGGGDAEALLAVLQLAL
jgi:hypothetical protein